MTQSSFRTMKHIGGITLIELLITLAIAAILLSLAVPSFTNSIRDNRVMTASTALSAAISFARAEAISRGRMVTLCPSTNGSACTGGNVWNLGWIVFVEPSTVTAVSAPDPGGAGAVMLQVVEEFDGTAMTKTDAGDAWLRFTSRGRITAVLDNTFDTVSSPCSNGVNKKTVLTVGTVGRVSTVTGKCP